MKPIIYVFSGTGNSLAVAKVIAKEINAEIVHIRDTTKAAIAANRVAGIIFPVYGWGCPAIVTRFLKRIKAEKSSYIFSVATCAGSAGKTNRIVEKTLGEQNISLSSGFVVKMPSNYTVFTKAEPDKKQMKKLSDADNKTKRIIKAVKNRSVRKPEISGIISPIIGSFVSSRFLSNVAKSDICFWTDENCNGCGTCAKICPVENIKMMKKHPSWNHKCEHCLACIQWCPKQAIQYGRLSENKTRYHHPDISLKDML